MSKGKENKIHIGIFGRRNIGKSSLINHLTGQDIAIVSDIAGTTTDPVKKSVEIPEIGAVIIIDTAGIDDTGTLGEMRIKKSFQALKTVDMAIIVFADNTFEAAEQNLIQECKKLEIPYFIIHNKSDLHPLDNIVKKQIETTYSTDVVDYSTRSSKPELLLPYLKKYIPEHSFQNKSLLGGLLQYGDIVLLVTPIDIEAPEGRIILPQIQAIRDILDNDSIAIVLKERELDVFFRKTNIKPKLVICDSQVILKADASVPSEIPLTGFSILLAYHKGNFDQYLRGTPKLSSLKDGDKVLILESCTHQVSCDDIGRVKIPRWLSNYTGKKLEFDVVSGLDKLPQDITKYSMVIQCGGCVITKRQLYNRLKPAIDAGVPVTNYGMAIAYLQGVYNRAIQPFVKNTTQGEDYL
ncbi:MAG: [FeFe] hydrogenase H-cluster maturation GTPase HydF [Bacteroidales bacterium]